MAQFTELASSRGLLVARSQISGTSVFLPGTVTAFYLAKYVALGTPRFDGYVGFSPADIRDRLSRKEQQITLRNCRAINIMNLKAVRDAAFVGPDAGSSLVTYLDQIASHLLSLTTGDQAHPPNYLPIDDLELTVTQWAR